MRDEHRRGKWTLTTGHDDSEYVVNVEANNGRFSEAELVRFATALLNAASVKRTARLAKAAQVKAHRDGVAKGDPHLRLRDPGTYVPPGILEVEVMTWRRT